MTNVKQAVDSDAARLTTIFKDLDAIPLGAKVGATAALTFLGKRAA